MFNVGQRVRVAGTNRRYRCKKSTSVTPDVDDTDWIKYDE